MPLIYPEHFQGSLITALEQVARGEALELDAERMQQVAACRQFAEQMIAERRRIYGVTTGYGPLAGTWIDPERSAQLQQGLIYHLSSGTGALLSPAQTRAVMAARAITLAQGYSGIRPEALQLLLDCLRLDLLPEVPSIGTVGASGDLTPLAHIALALTGQGRMRWRGTSWAAAEALKECKLSPLTPEGKDALALVNGTSAMTGIAALNDSQSSRLLQLSVILTALYGELLQAHQEALQPGLARVRPHPGQRWAQQALMLSCQDSQRMLPCEQPPPFLPEQLGPDQTMQNQPLLQDAYTFRCAPQHLGAVADTLMFHHQVVSCELESVTDNPVFIPEQKQVLHGGNFFGQHVALAADALNNALVTLAVHSERRMARITDPLLNRGLPPFLRGNNNGLHSGFMGAQVTATALVAEMRTHAQPASIQSIPTNANNQDVVTLGTLAARRCSETLQHLHDLLAIECLMLAQAWELSGGEAAGFSSKAGDLVRLVRSISEPLENDRPLADDIQKLSSELQQPDFMASLLADLPMLPFTASSSCCMPE